MIKVPPHHYTPEMGMPSTAFSTLFSPDQEQSSNLSDRSLPNPASLQDQPDDKCPPSPPVFSDAPIPDHLPPKSETSAIPPLQPDLRGQVPLGTRLEKGKEVKITPYVQQPDSNEDFNMATIHILCEPVVGSRQIRRVARALLDTASDDNMVSRDTVTKYLGMSSRIQVVDKRFAIPIATMNGDEVNPDNEIELVFYGEGGMNRRTYSEIFRVMDGDLPWEIILGKHFLQKWGVYKRIGLVGVHPRKTEVEVREAPARQRKHEVERAENEMMVREQEEKERTTSPSAQMQRNEFFSNSSRHQDRHQDQHQDQHQDRS